MLKHIMEDFCPKCSSPTRKQPSGISKKGRPYPAFMTCTSRGCDWTGGTEVDTKSTPGTLGTIDADTGEEIKEDEDQGKRILDGLLKIYKKLDEIELKIDSLLPESRDNGESFKL